MARPLLVPPANGRAQTRAAFYYFFKSKSELAGAALAEDPGDFPSLPVSDAGQDQVQAAACE
jgi:hypothetical protein